MKLGELPTIGDATNPFAKIDAIEKWAAVFSLITPQIIPLVDPKRINLMGVAHHQVAAIRGWEAQQGRCQVTDR